MLKRKLCALLIGSLSLSSLQAFDFQDLRDFYSHWLYPNRIVIGSMVGTSAAVALAIETYRFFTDDNRLMCKVEKSYNEVNDNFQGLDRLYKKLNSNVCNDVQSCVQQLTEQDLTDNVQHAYQLFRVLDDKASAIYTLQDYETQINALAHKSENKTELHNQATQLYNCINKLLNSIDWLKECKHVHGDYIYLHRAVDAAHTKYQYELTAVGYSLDVTNEEKSLMNIDLHDTQFKKLKALIVEHALNKQWRFPYHKFASQLAHDLNNITDLRKKVGERYSTLSACAENLIVWLRAILQAVTLSDDYRNDQIEMSKYEHDQKIDQLNQQVANMQSQVQQMQLALNNAHYNRPSVVVYERDRRR